MSLDKVLIIIMILYYFSIIALMFFMFTKRKQAIKNRQVEAKHFKSYQGATTEYLAIIQNHFNNQFQIPILFFFACLLTMQQNNVTSLTIILAVSFVTTRLYHSFQHLGANHLLKRAYGYFLGVLIVGAMLVLNVV